jgi:hypothetical protein
MALVWFAYQVALVARRSDQRNAVPFYRNWKDVGADLSNSGMCQSSLDDRDGCAQNWSASRPWVLRKVFVRNYAPDLASAGTMLNIS